MFKTVQIFAEDAKVYCVEDGPDFSACELVVSDNEPCALPGWIPWLILMMIDVSWPNALHSYAVECTCSSDNSVTDDGDGVFYCEEGLSTDSLQAGYVKSFDKTLLDFLDTFAEVFSPGLKSFSWASVDKLIVSSCHGPSNFTELLRQVDPLD
ncbi:hypothetical protein Nepgr_002768 [Nepenthes gracilis]|uniref:Uncharacterized protein n=1 Tax=Nepenthes gracilis TaxID=150966 RepID=A0AAD3P6X7_NEPGR|nr:hypothetical protein Nepgr_002768 [Nepenthes gracilis]